MSPKRLHIQARVAKIILPKRRLLLRLLKDIFISLDILLSLDVSRIQNRAGIKLQTYRSTESKLNRRY